MSISALLVPLGIAALGAIAESRSTDLCEKCKTTRINDMGLLMAALSDMGAQVRHQGTGEVLATSVHGSLTFQMVGGVVLGRVDGHDERTPAMLAELDQAVGRVTQAHTARLIEARAHELGYRLVTKDAEDGSITYVFEEAR